MCFQCVSWLSAQMQWSGSSWKVQRNGYWDDNHLISIVCVPFVYHPLTACVFVLYSLGLFMLLCEVVCCICLFFTDCFPSSLQDDGDVEDDMTIREVRRAATQNLLLLWFKCCFLCTFYVFIWLFIKGKLQIWHLKGDLPKESWKAVRSFDLFLEGLENCHMYRY